MKKKIFLKGRIDTATAAATETEIAKQLEGCSQDTEIILDCTMLSYISSTGLRVILKYKKLFPLLRIVNANAEVYNVFEITGFSRIISIEKALRKIDLTTCTLLARGANGEVYKINDEEIVKLSLFANREDELIEEMNRAREAFVLGVPTMISFDEVEVNDGRRGIVLEALNSTTLAQHLKEHPEQLDSYLEPYINLFRTTNAIVTQPGQFRSAKQELLNRLMAPTRFLDDETTAEIKSLIEALPDGLRLVHADGHPCNALLCGEADSRNLMLIDMGDLSAGHPIFEIIGWAFLMNGTDYSPARIIGPRILGLDYPYLQQMFRKMLALYLHIEDEATLDKAVWASAQVAILRLVCTEQIRNVPVEKRPRGIEMARQTIAHSRDIRDAIVFLTDMMATM